jgi:hypothetical protein
LGLILPTVRKKKGTDYRSFVLELALVALRNTSLPV